MNPVRRISEALREMRWAQVVLELALLILGILIALAVDGWMDDRRDARAERQYLALMVSELDRDLEMLDEYFDFEERPIEDGIRAYRALREGVAPRPDHNLPQMATAMARFRDRLGVPVDASNDRLWDLPADAPDLAILANKVWFRGFVSYAAIAQMRDVSEDIQSLREEITDELATRRWP